MTQYVWRDGGWVDKKTGQPLTARNHNGAPPLDEVICAPMVMRDMPEHVGPSGRLISSRSQFRDECKRTGSVPFDRGLKGSSGYLDPRVAKANGKKHDPENVQRWKAGRKQALKDAGLA